MNEITKEMDTEEALQIIKKSAQKLINVIDDKSPREYMFIGAWKILDDTLREHCNLIKKVSEIKGY